MKPKKNTLEGTLKNTSFRPPRYPPVRVAKFWWKPSWACSLCRGSKQVIVYKTEFAKWKNSEITHFYI
jgi:hypothetical protein